MIDKKWIGEALPPATLRTEPGRLAFFAKAIGEGATEADQTVPPTFLFSAYADESVYLGLLDRMGVPHERLLHGEQEFEYLAAIHAGDEIQVHGRVADVREKRNGSLEFIEIRAEATNQSGAAVARMRSLLVIRNPRPA